MFATFDSRCSGVALGTWHWTPRIMRPLAAGPQLLARDYPFIAGGYSNPCCEMSRNLTAMGKFAPCRPSCVAMKLSERASSCRARAAGVEASWVGAEDCWYAQELARAAIPMASEMAGFLDWRVGLGPPVQVELGSVSECATIQADVVRISRPSGPVGQSEPAPG